jgi:hypothetical protein
MNCPLAIVLFLWAASHRGFGAGLESFLARGAAGGWNSFWRRMSSYMPALAEFFVEQGLEEADAAAKARAIFADPKRFFRDFNAGCYDISTSEDMIKEHGGKS